MAERWICTNCGVAYPPSDAPPRVCPICEDERVTNPPTQAWIDAHELAATHATEIRSCERGVLSGIGVVPDFAIGQRALIVEYDDGCILWDCISVVDQNAIDFINARGGLRAIAISHPHFHGAMAQWSAAFDDAPVYVHEADRRWVVDAPPALRLWSGEMQSIAPGVTLVRCGGHFDGATVMHVGGAADGAGALLTGDTIMVTEFARGVSFMRSYPTYVPLNKAQVRFLRDAVEPLKYTKIYGAWWDRVIEHDGPKAVARAVGRYLDAVEEKSCRQTPAPA